MFIGSALLLIGSCQSPLPPPELISGVLWQGAGAYSASFRWRALATDAVSGQTATAAMFVLDRVQLGWVGVAGRLCPAAPQPPIPGKNSFLIPLS